MNFIDWKFEMMFKIWKRNRLAEFFAAVVSVTENQPSISRFYSMVFIR